jgi:hypothetical protein
MPLPHMADTPILQIYGLPLSVRLRLDTREQTVEPPARFKGSVPNRRPTKVAGIALANRIARMAWAMMAKGERYKEPAALAA